MTRTSSSPIAKRSCVRLLVLVLSTAGIAWGQERGKLVSQGEYSAVGKKGGQVKNVQMDEWRMYALQDGTYSVSTDAILRDKQHHLEEREILTKDLEPEIFEVATSDDRDAAHAQDMKIHCDFGASAVVCQSTLKGVSSSATFAEKKPYVFIPTFEGPSSDMCWFVQGIGVQADRFVGRQTDIPTISIDDGPQNTIGLQLQETEHLEYLGRDNVEVLGQTVSAHKFSWRSSSGGPAETLWLSNSGLLLRFDSTELSIVLSSYQGPTL